MFETVKPIRVSDELPRVFGDKLIEISDIGYLKTLDEKSHRNLFFSTPGQYDLDNTKLSKKSPLNIYCHSQNGYNFIANKFEDINIIVVMDPKEQSDYFFSGTIDAKKANVQFKSNSFCLVGNVYCNAKSFSVHNVHMKQKEKIKKNWIEYNLYINSDSIQIYNSNILKNITLHKDDITNQKIYGYFT